MRYKETILYKAFATVRLTLSLWRDKLGVHPETGEIVRIDFLSAFKTALFIWWGIK